MTEPTSSKAILVQTQDVDDSECGSEVKELEKSEFLDEVGLKVHTMGEICHTKSHLRSWVDDLAGDYKDASKMEFQEEKDAVKRAQTAFDLIVGSCKKQLDEEVAQPTSLEVFSTQKPVKLAAKDPAWNITWNSQGQLSNVIAVVAGDLHEHAAERLQKDQASGLTAVSCKEELDERVVEPTAGEAFSIQKPFEVAAKDSTGDIALYSKGSKTHLKAVVAGDQQEPTAERVQKNQACGLILSSYKKKEDKDLIQPAPDEALSIQKPYNIASKYVNLDLAWYTKSPVTTWMEVQTAELEEACWRESGKKSRI